jgi:hypothetical protein
MLYHDDSGYRFGLLAQQLLRTSGFRIVQVFEVGGLNVDVLALRDGERWAVTIKYYRTERAQISLLEAAAAQLLTAARDAGVKNGMLVVSARLASSHRTALEERYGLSFVDRADLIRMAAAAPELADELTALLELAEPAREDSDGRTADVLVADARRTSDRYVPTPRVDTQGTNLCNELRALPKGRPAWGKYEKLCDRILRYLFSTGLHGWHKQQRTDDGLNRFDYVCRIRPAAEFWRFLVDNLNSRYLLFEFKNYTRQINQGQILTTEKYLLEKGLRRVGIILSRSGASAVPSR